jgi:hypothetical protein
MPHHRGAGAGSIGVCLAPRLLPSRMMRVPAQLNRNIRHHKKPFAAALRVPRLAATRGVA